MKGRSMKISISLIVLLSCVNALFAANTLNIQCVDLPSSVCVDYRDNIRRALKDKEFRFDGIAYDSMFVEIRKLRVHHDKKDVTVRINLFAELFYYSDVNGKRIRLFVSDEIHSGTGGSISGAYESVWNGGIIPVLNNAMDEYRKGRIEPPRIVGAQIRPVYPSHLGKGIIPVKLHIDYPKSGNDSLVDVSIVCGALFNGEKNGRLILKKSQNEYVYNVFVDKNVVRQNEGVHQGTVRVRYANTPQFSETPVTVVVKNSNAMTWRDSTVLGAFVNEHDPAIRAIARKALSHIDEKDNIISSLHQAMTLYYYLQSYNMDYRMDPRVENGEDKIYFPRETLKNRIFDCDDISILYVNLLESVGIKTSFILYKEHITVAIHSGIAYENYDLIHFDKERFINHKGELLIPIEGTFIAKNRKESFERSWRKSAEYFHAKKKHGETVTILPFSHCRKRFTAVNFDIEKPEYYDGFSYDMVRNELQDLKNTYKKELFSMADKSVEEVRRAFFIQGKKLYNDAIGYKSLKSKRSYAAVNNKAIILACEGKYTEALTLLESCLENDYNEHSRVNYTIISLLSKQGSRDTDSLTTQLKTLQKGLWEEYYKNKDGVVIVLSDEDEEQWYTDNTKSGFGDMLQTYLLWRYDTAEMPRSKGKIIGWSTVAACAIGGLTYFIIWKKQKDKYSIELEW